MHEPLEGIDPCAWRDVVDAGEADGLVARRDARQRCAVWAHAEGFVEDGGEIGETVEGGRRGYSGVRVAVCNGDGEARRCQFAAKAVLCLLVLRDVV